MYQQGSYSLIVGMNANGTLTQEISVDVKPTNAFTPLIIAVVLFIVAAAAWVAFSAYLKRKQLREREMDQGMTVII